MGYSINFPAESEPDNKRRVLRLQIGKRFIEIESKIQNTCSNSLREYLNVDSFDGLRDAAKNAGASINAYALTQIKEGFRKDSPDFIGGIEGTYRGNTDDFFHQLFPYLEAFSPKFVTSIRDKYSPEAKLLLDPFGGLGTAPFSFSDNFGCSAYYCEVNPLMQFIARLKSELRVVDLKTRTAAGKRILTLSKKLEKLTSSESPDLELLESYQTAFKGSDFFNDKTLDQVLRIRTLIDRLYCEDRIVAICLELSVLASLVTASKMQRAGDLRRKRANELSRISSNLYEHVSLKLESFKDGLLSFTQWNETPKLLTEDSRKLNKIPLLDVDIVITSPPYLNGTNYFRNTKIELWFIGVIKNKDDLGSLRDKAITAGINDVRGIRTREIPPSKKFSSIKKALSLLDKNSYDRRIPQMIRWYAHDLDEALRGAIKHLKLGGVIAVDIGDSVYCNVLVPTDKLVEEILTKNDCRLIENIIVRKRTSRSGVEVKQVCIVARKAKHQDDIKCNHDNIQWDNFKENLPHTKQPYSKRNWGHVNHSLCSYQGKLKPSIAKFLTDTFVPEGGSVLDPFSGVGTIPFEAALAGKTSYGFDISPAAVAISRAKLSLHDRDTITKQVKNLERYIRSHSTDSHRKQWLPSFNKDLEDYYHQDTLKEIISARNWFKMQSPWDEPSSLMIACCMHILHGNRPYALSRRSHPITPFAPTGDYEKKSLIEKLNQKLDKSIAAEYPEIFRPGKIFTQDITEPWPLEVQNLDAIITSPPFFDSTRFHLANWIRLWFSGWEKHEFEFEQKRFIDEKQKNSFDCYDSIFRSAKERLKSNGHLVFHLGKSRKCDMGLELITRSKTWFTHSELFTESVEHCESHGIRDKGTVTDHQYLVLY